MKQEGHQPSKQPNTVKGIQHQYKCYGNSSPTEEEARPKFLCKTNNRHKLEMEKKENLTVTIQSLSYNKELHWASTPIAIKKIKNKVL